MQYRFVTPHRRGKWYPSIKVAQENAVKIGAGFFDDRDGKFYQYRESHVEARSSEVMLSLPLLPDLRARPLSC